MLIDFTLNGETVSLDANPITPLLDVLREELGLTGTKQGCDHEGECGACTVLLNGSPVRSCLTPIGKVQGQQVLTIEGLGSPETPHPLQTAFMEAGAVQCGYCIPGMLLTSKALLDRSPDPAREEIQEALSGNLCRCTGYQRIIGAVQAAARQIRSQADLSKETPLPEVQGIGGSHRRMDAWEKVSGSLRFAADLLLPGALEILVVRSPHHHARLVSLAVPKASRVPGVTRVITAEDIPGENGLGDYSREEPVLTPAGETCKMLGAPVALIAAESREAALSALDVLDVQFQPLPHFFFLEEALQDEGQKLYSHGNRLTSSAVQWGDLEKVMAESDLILETSYRTSWQEHAALEREALLGYYDQQGRLTVVGGTHEPHWQQGYIASCLSLDPQQVRVIMPPTGGSFGGKQDPWPFLATALVVHLTGQPARLLYTREESFQASPKRHPYQVKTRIGANSSGDLTGIQTRVLINTGGYDGHGQYITDYALAGSGGPYRFQAVDGRAESIYTNGPKGGQFRGFGTPQAVFSLECTLDEIAQTLDIDPLAFRRQNAIHQETRSYLGYPIQESLGYQEVLEAIQPSYLAYLEEAAEFNQRQQADSPLRIGVGFSGMWYRFGKSGSLKVEAGAALSEQGELIITCSAPDYGQGSSTVMSQMAAEVLGVPRGQIKLINADTALTPDSGIQGASRSTYFVGGAVVKAAETLKRALLEAASEMLDCHPQALSLTAGGIICAQPPREDNTPEAVLSYQEIAAEFRRLNIPLAYTGRFDLSALFPDDQRPQYIPLFVTGAQAVLVRVNLETGQVRIPKITAAHDVGRAVNPRDARGQIEGAVLMGLGTALMEEYLPGLTKGFGDYYLPTSLSTPQIETILVEVPSFQGPFGVKGLGEAAILPTAPAILSGISRVVGTRIRRLPATPEVVLQAVKAGEQRRTG